MSDGTISLSSIFYGNIARGDWKNQRYVNIIDGGSHFYNVYQCADDRWISLGSIEPQFYSLMLEKTGIDDPDFQNQMDKPGWPALREKMAKVIRTRTRDEWYEILNDTDACFAPVLDFEEAPQHPHNVAREMFIELDGVAQPSPVPKFSETPGAVQHPPVASGQHNEEALLDWGLTETEIKQLKESGAL